DGSKDAATLVAMTLPALFIRLPAAAAPFGWRTALALGMVLAGLALVHRIVRVLEGRSVAAWTTFALLYGTFLYAYPAIAQDPLLHATGFLLGAAALELWWRWRCSLSAPRLAAWVAVMAAATA